LRLVSRIKSAAAMAFVAMMATAQAAEAQYTYTKIMYPASTWTEASGINDAGQIVGTYTDTSGVAHGFLYQNGVYTKLDYPGKAHNYAFGIDDAGNVVGSFSEVMPRGPYHASLRLNGVWSEYDFPGNETDGRAINTNGDIVGIYNAGYGTPDHGFLKIGENYTSIDYPGASLTYVFGLNDAGWVTGTYRDATGLLKGFAYKDGAYASVVYPTATETYIGGINNLNAMVGWKVEGGKVGGFVAMAGKYRPVIATFANAANTRARAINDVGQIVGTYTSPECTIGCSFVATPSPSVLPTCDQTVGMTYTNGTLNTSFTLNTGVATTWTTWLVYAGVPYRLWSLPLGVIRPAQTVLVPIQLAPAGTVVLASYLSTPANGTICVDFATLNLGGGQ
jgi:probable HAF family extracellular repeat protein